MHLLLDVNCLIVDIQLLAHINSTNTFISWVQHSSTAANSAVNGTGLSESADDDLPSVMTCANYLKLPPYSTKVI